MLKRVFFLCVLCGSILPGCKRDESKSVVLYTSIDQPVAAPIVAEFEKQTGIKVTLVTDTESTKSVGLTERLRAEKSNPQADVWWNNEPFNTINLADEGVLAPYNSTAVSDVPAKFKDPQHRWSGNAARVRVIAWSTKDDQTAKELAGLARDTASLMDPLVKGKIAMARPTAGTTGGFVAALYVQLGDDRANELFKGLRLNEMSLLGGNSAVAESVASGTRWVGLTDNDDVEAARADGGKIQLSIPDQTGFGCLIIPSTVGLVTGAKHDTEAKRLIDFLLSKQVEQKLVDVKFAYGSLRTLPSDMKQMDVDYTAVAHKMPEAIRRATAILEGRE